MPISKSVRRARFLNYASAIAWARSPWYLATEMHPGLDDPQELGLEPQDDTGWTVFYADTSLTSGGTGTSGSRFSGAALKTALEAASGGLYTAAQAGNVVVEIWNPTNTKMRLNINPAWEPPRPYRIRFRTRLGDPKVVISAFDKVTTAFTTSATPADNGDPIYELAGYTATFADHQIGAGSGRYSTKFRHSFWVNGMQTRVVYDAMQLPVDYTFDTAGNNPRTTYFDAPYTATTHSSTASTTTQINLSGGLTVSSTVATGATVVTQNGAVWTTTAPITSGATSIAVTNVSGSVPAASQGVRIYPLSWNAGTHLPAAFNSSTIPVGATLTFSNGASGTTTSIITASSAGFTWTLTGGTNPGTADQVWIRPSSGVNYDLAIMRAKSKGNWIVVDEAADKVYFRPATGQWVQYTIDTAGTGAYDYPTNTSTGWRVSADHRVAATGAGVANTFHTDFTIEFAARSNVFFTPSGDTRRRGYEFRRLHFEGGATWFQEGAVTPGSDSRFDYCEFSRSHWQGLRIGGTSGSSYAASRWGGNGETPVYNVHFRGCYFHHHGVLAFGTHRAVNVTFTDCLFAFNCLIDADSNWEGGSFKLNQSHSIRLENCVMRHSYGPLGWQDYKCGNVVYRDCRLHEGSGSGIQHELSYQYHPMILDNVAIYKCGFTRPETSIGGALFGYDAPVWTQGEVILFDNRMNILLRGDNRGDYTANNREEINPGGTVLAGVISIATNNTVGTSRDGSVGTGDGRGFKVDGQIDSVAWWTGANDPDGIWNGNEYYLNGTSEFWRCDSGPSSTPAGFNGSSKVLSDWRTFLQSTLARQYWEQDSYQGLNTDQRALDHLARWGIPSAFHNTTPTYSQAEPYRLDAIA